MPSAKKFRQEIWQYYHDHKRILPWRDTTDPYKIMVSEIMLQQTQANRVISFYENFLRTFPSVHTLAAAPIKDVLVLWQGLGYNRRAVYLHQAAKKIITDFGGQVPSTIDELITLPGVGKNTAGAILAYSFNQPVTFIETNIRKTIIHFFFAHLDKVSDHDVSAIVTNTIDKLNPREWYWAMVDYGSELGRQRVVRNDRSQSYKKQSSFEGSNRQLRARLLRYILEQPRRLQEIESTFPNNSTKKNLTNLQQDGLIREKDGIYQI